jgi:cytochrome c553
VLFLQLSGKNKRMNIRNAIAASAAGMLLAGAALADGDAAAGKQKTTMCQGCHGIPGYKTAFPSVYNVPKLGGQHAGYIVKALQGYKSGERSHPTMRAIAAGLTDKDMADLAAYYAADDMKTAGK